MTLGALVRLAGVTASATVGTALGLTGAALGTDSGRAVVVAAALRLANDALRGTVSLDSVGGSVYRGLVAHGVRVVGDDGRPLAEIGTLQVRYRLSDLLSRRIVLGQLEVSDVRVTLERRAGERFNYQTVLRLGEGDGGGRGPLVAFRNVVVTGLTVTVRTPAGHDSTELFERRIVVPAARLTYARLSSPFPGESGILFDVGTLRADLPHPALAIRHAEGRAEVLGDTVTLNLDRVDLRDTRTTMRGRLWSLGGGPRFDLAFDAQRFDARDVADLFPWMPDGLTGRGRMDAASPVDGVVRVRGRDLRLATADGGTARGTLALEIGPGDEWAATDLDLSTTDFDLALLRGLLDTLPVDGRLSGRTRARGPRRAVAVELDWVFHDRRADSAATSLAAAGTVAFGVPGDIAFRELRVDRAAVPLATVRVLSPGIALAGTISAAGVLDGEWRNATFTGTLAHRRDSLPVTRAQGSIRLDVRADTAGVWGTLALDSLAWDGVRPSYPAAPFAGKMAGDVRLAGRLDALALEVALRGPAGEVEGGGTVVLMSPHLGVRDMDVRFRDLVLRPVERRLARTALSGRLTGTVELDPLAAPHVDLAAELSPSLVGGAPVDSVRARIRMQDSVLVADTVRAWLRGVGLQGRGGVALRAPRRDSLALRLDADSLGALAPLLLQLAGRDTAALARDTLRGGVAGAVALTGALDRFEVTWSVSGARVRWNDVVAHGARAGGRWASWRSGRVALQLEIDSVRTAAGRFDRVVAAGAGTADSVHWLARSGIGRDADLRVGGVWVRRASWEARLDSLVLEIAGDSWSLAPGASLTVTDSAITVRDAVLSTATGRSRLTLSGVVPRTGAGGFEGTVETLPLRHVWALLQRDPETTAGELNGTFRVGGTAREPVIEGSLSMRDAMFNDVRAPLTDGTVAYRDRRLTGALNMWRSGVRVLEMDLELPLDLGFTGVRTRRLSGPLTVRARADGVDLALLTTTTPSVQRTEGLLLADMAITGSWDRPQLQGYLEVRGGAATFPALGVRHRDLNGRLTLSGDTIRVDSLSVWSGVGRATVRGVVRLVELTRPVLDLTIEGSEFRALDIPDFLTVTASGSLGLDGPVFGARLTGSGTIPRGTVHFADIIKKDIISLEDTLTLDSAAAAVIREQRLGPAFENRFLDSLRIEGLRLEMGNDVHLRSSEADILLTGGVLVGKVADRYRIDGTLRTPRGTYELYLGPTVRKRFTVTRGEVRYFGTPDLNAALDIDARHQLRGIRGEDVTVFVHVGGTILEPELRLWSDVQPTLSETEIISYLVFGAPSAQAASGGVGRYGIESVAAITGQVFGHLGSQIIADLGVPLDFLEVRPQVGARGVEAAEIAVGRRLSDRVIVTLSPRICRKQSFSVQNLGGSLELELGAGWSMLASADPVRVCSLSGSAGFGTQYQLGMDLFWEKRF